MKKRIISLILTFSILLSIVPLNALTAFAQDNILYGDADGNGKVELLDVNLMERYIEGDEEAKAGIHFTEADVNADGEINDVDVQMVKDYLVGNLDSLTPILHTISFVTDGGGDFAPVKAGDGYPYRGELPTPAKDDYVFVNWKMENGETYYPLTEVVTEDMVLTAVYEPVPPKEQLNLTSFSLDNQKPDVSFDITGEFAGAEEVKANITVLPKDGSDPVTVDVKDNGDGTFTVYAPDGFNAGASYELTLGDGLTFVDKDAMFRTVYFIIEKAEADNLKYNPDMIFIKDTDEMKYTIDGETVDVLQSALLSNEEGTEAIKGSFPMSHQDLEQGDIVCIYQNTDPRDRDYTQDDYENDAMAFIEIIGVDGDTYHFESLDEEDTEKVLAMPGSFPFRAWGQLPTADGTINVNSYDAYVWGIMGNTEAPQFKEGDFITFYTDDYDFWTEETQVAYAQITKVENGTISYKIVTKEDIEDYMGLFVSQRVDSSEILENLDEEEFLEQVEQQAVDSGFAEEAADHMVQNALETEQVQQKLLAAGFTMEEISQLRSASSRAVGVGGRVKFTAEKPVVHASTLESAHFEDGVGIALDVSIVLSFDQKLAGKVNSLKIELTAGFEQEVALDFDLDIDDRWTWYAFIPVLDEVTVTGAIDIQNYTYMSVGAKVYTVSEDNLKKWKALSDTTHTNPKVLNAIRQINKLSAKRNQLVSRGESADEVLNEIKYYQEQLPAIRVDGEEYSVAQIEEALQAEDISAAFDDVWNAQDKAEAKTGMEQLMDKYKGMLEQETDWVELINQPLIDQTYWIAIAAVKVNLNFVVKANVNIQLGADMEYQVGKRYNFWIHVLGRTSGSSEMDLIDERFAFQFYVMGTLGVKAGVKAEIAFGILSTDLASVGANVEFGAYVKLYGYFIYYFEDLRPANTSLSQETEEMMGALYVDFGLYVTVKFKAQVFLNLIKYEPTLYDGEFPLLTAGVRQSVYDFALEPDEEDILYVWDDDANSTNGISMSLPEIYRTMKRIDLVTGEKSQAAYDKDNFIVVFNDERFSCSGGNIIVDVPENTRYMTAEARIIWKNDKLTFSKYDTDITVPVVWTNMSQSELNEKFTASVAVGNEKDGYTKVWSGRYGRLDVFDLPTEEEILELIDYDSYNLEDGTNLKYESVGGYREETTGQSLARDKTWYFDVEPKQYTVTVKNIQNADGTTTEKIFTANYRESFDFSDLKNTGANNPETMQFSTFRGLTDQETDGEPVTSITVDMAFAEKYGSNAVLYAHYIDDTLTATFEFSGLGMSIEPMKVKFQRGTVPYPGDILGYIYEMTGDESGITYDITPELTSSVASVTYTVNCRLSWEPLKKVTFFNNGAWFHEQLYRAGMTIFKPTAPVRTGYTFVGWRDSSGITYTGDTLGVMGDQNMTFFAIYNANDYYVYYDTQDVNIPNPEPMKLKYDERYDYYYDGNYSLPVLSSEDRVFLGWFTEPEGGTAFKPNMNTLFTGTENMTVYAHWKPFVEVTGDWITNTTPTYTYTGKAQAFTFTVQDPTGNTSALTPENFTVTYLAQTDGAEWTTEPPVNAGAYAVKLELNDNEYYKQTEEIYFEVGVVINKADPEPQSNLFYVTNWVVSPRWSTPSDGKITFKLYKGSINNWSEIGTYTDSPFTIPENQRDNGTYGLQVSVAESQNYTAGESNIYPMDVDGDTGNSTARPPRNAAVNTMTSPAFYSVFPVSLTEKVTKDVMTLSASAKHDTGAVALTNVNASGNPAMTLSPEEIVLNRGKEFEVTLGLDQATDVWGILAAVNYDTDTLELLGYTCGDIFTEAQFTAQNDRTAAPYKLLATLDEIGTTSADGSFVTLKFKVKEDAAEKATFISLETLEVVGENTSIPVDKGDETRMAVDETAPVIEGIVDGETYCPDQTFTVSETNLVSVTVNGEVQTAVDGKYTVAAGDDEQCIVVVTDKAGNCTTYTVTVEHTYGDSWVTDELSHWHECECGDKMDVAEHEFVWVVTKEAEVGVAGEKHEECKVCGYEKAPVEIPALVDGGNSPSTGDSNNILLWVALLFVSGGVLIIPIFVSVRKVRRKL